jgi:hypothetical protein
MSTRRERAKAQNAQQSKLEGSASIVRTVKEQDHPVAKKLGDFFIDISKLIIGGVILAGLMKQDIDYLMLSIVGGVVVVLFLLFGIWLINYANRRTI